LQIIDGLDLREHTEVLLSNAVARVVADCCPSDFSEEWDLQRLVVEITQYYPTKFTVEDFEEAVTTEQLIESVLTEAYEYYDEREQGYPGGAETARQIERNLMLQVIDQRWREHLVELDYLREGIHLRGIAQTDPLNAWQREGYEMFEQLWSAIDEDYLRYVLHVDVVVDEVSEDGSAASSAGPSTGDLGAALPPNPALGQAEYVAADDPLEDGPSVVRSPEPVTAAGLAPAARGVPAGAGARPGAPAAGVSGAVAGDRRASGPGGARAGNGASGAPHAKIGRNDPCYCGSGKKFKLCHGAS
jgi:preprotein translocase subunit SecA